MAWPNSMNAASRIQGTLEVHSDGPSCEDALEEHDDPKINPALQAAQARTDTKAAISGH